ncbi:unnamed protein product [Rotaria magnacalcarata]|uniref:Uncharacterized protein n=1 Tax=Rotaria magnacalcarata TaxID=392030 RepID=A0A819NCL7_9BILA|nr:unnamed protein product [Rotaria magnacalcarata]
MTSSNKAEKDQQTNIKLLQEENKQLKVELKESNAQVEKLNALVSKQMKDIEKLSGYISKLNKDMEELKEKLKACEDEIIRDDSSNSSSPPPYKKKKIEKAMSTSSSYDLISTILTKPNKTSNDLHEIINKWRDDLTKNEEYLLQYAYQLSQKQASLNKTTESFIEAQNLLGNIEDNLEQFQLSTEALHKYNNELENNIEQLNNDSKTRLPNILSNMKIEQDRPMVNDLMESVDNQLNELVETTKQLYGTLQIGTDSSIVKTIDELQTCFRDIDNIQETMKQIKL